MAFTAGSETVGWLDGAAAVFSPGRWPDRRALCPRDRLSFLRMTPNSEPPTVTDDTRFDDGEWAAWYSLTPLQRLEESCKLWETYLKLGGTLDPEPDSQSPFFDPDEWRAGALDGRPGLRVVRRGGV